MITKFKIYEDINTRNEIDKPEVGDYVITDHHWYNKGHIPIFKVYSIDNDLIFIYLNNKYEVYHYRKILYWSKNIEDLKVLVDSKKYNL